MEIVPFQAATQYLHESSLPHLLLYIGVGTDVEEDIEADIEQFILFPDEDIKFLQLRTGSNPIILIVPPPHLDIFAIHEIEPLNLVLQHLDDGCSHLILC